MNTASPDRLKAVLAEELDAAGLFPPPEISRSFAREAFAAGQTLMKEITGELGWGRVFSGLNAACLPGMASGGVALLGWSCKLADYLLYPVLPAGPERKEAARLGALANLVANLYDHVLERRLVDPASLVLTGLPPSSGPARPVSLPGRLLQRPVGRLLEGLVSLYFRRLEVFLQKDGQDLLQFTKSLARSMYAAEHDQAGGGRCRRISQSVKDIYPFLVMGVPAWRAVPSARLRQAHFFFLYRFGKFIGLLDDAADFERDLRAGSPNLLRMEAAGEDFAPAAARRIASMGKRVRQDWVSLRRFGGSPPDPALEQSLCHIIGSWFHPGLRFSDPH